MAAAVRCRSSAVVVAVCFVAAVCGVCEAEKTTEKTTLDVTSQVIPKLTYFNIKGRAEAIRLAFFIGGIAFEDVRIRFSTFRKIKPSLPLGQLPVLELGDKMYAESKAILIYAGREAGLMPVKAEEELQVNQILEALQEVVEKCLGVLNQTNEEKKKEMAVTLITDILPHFMVAINDMVQDGSASEFAVGDMLTVADISLYCVMDFIIEKGAPVGVPRKFFEHEAFLKLKRVYDIVGSIPRVIEWEAKPHPEQRALEEPYPEQPQPEEPQPEQKKLAEIDLDRL